MRKNDSWADIATTATITASITIVLIFGIYEIFERYFLTSANSDLIRILHIIRGVGTTFLVAGILTVILTRRYSPEFQSAYTAASSGIHKDKNLIYSGHSFSFINLGVRWLIGLRWMAWIATTTAIFITITFLSILQERETVLPLILCSLFLAASNLIYQQYMLVRVSAHFHIVIQIVMDLVILTTMLHFSGGSENPFLIIYIFHVIIGSILLPRRTAYAITALVGSLFSGLIFLETTGRLAHYTLLIFPHHKEGLDTIHGAHHLPYVITLCAVFWGVILLVSYFTASLAQALRAGLKTDNEVAIRHLHTAKLSSLGEMAAGVAHEIRNPLGSIQVASEKLQLMLKEGQFDRFPDYLEMIEGDAERSQKVVNQLLDFSRQENINLVATSLPDTCKTAMRLLELNPRYNEIHLEVEVSPHLPLVKAVPDSLIQALVNLLQNAYDAALSSISLSARLNPEDSSIVMVIVSDDGEGVPPEIEDRLFKAFVSTKTSNSGTGLGLAITKRLVEQMDGNITVENTPGASFTISLKSWAHHDD